MVGKKQNRLLQLSFSPRLKAGLQGPQVTSESGRLSVREHDEPVLDDMAIANFETSTHPTNPSETILRSVHPWRRAGSCRNGTQTFSKLRGFQIC